MTETTHEALPIELTSKSSPTWARSHLRAAHGPRSPRPQRGHGVWDVTRSDRWIPGATVNTIVSVVRFPAVSPNTSFCAEVPGR